MQAKWLAAALIGIIALVVILGVSSNRGADPRFSIPYSQFLNKVQEHQVSKVYIDNGTIYGMGVDQSSFWTDAPHDPGLMGDLLANNVEITSAPTEKRSFFNSFIMSWLPFIILIGIFVYFARRSQAGGANGASKFGKSKAKAFGTITRLACTNPRASPEVMESKAPLRIFRRKIWLGFS